MLVHGGFAHAHWWDFIAPLFLEEYCVAAVDLSGMGDSGHRPKYTGELFAKEVMAVCVDAGFSNRPFVAGHSFGGYVALQAGALYGQDLGGIVMVDFPIRPPELQRQHEASRPLVRKKEIYPQLENALARFRLIPEQPCDNRFILQHIARHSIAQVQGGWAWKFDDQVFSDFELGNIRENVEKISCPMAVIYGDQSALFPPEVIDYMTGLLAPRIPMVALAGAHHHLFLEQPLAFVETLRNLLKRWHHP